MTRNKRHVVVVEDETTIRQGLIDVLTYQGFEVAAFDDGETALEHAGVTSFDLAILDVMLPGVDGFEVCARLREKYPEPPILMLTAKGSEDDVVHGFRRGADDYVIKPFSVRELLARVEALLRRATNNSPGDPSIQFGPWLIEPSEMRAVAGDEVRELTPREVEIAAFFIQRKGRIVSRRSLLKEVWEMSCADEVETRTVDMHIAKLRKKLDPDFDLLKTIRGAGYRFEG